MKASWNVGSNTNTTILFSAQSCPPGPLQVRLCHPLLRILATASPSAGGGQGEQDAFQPHGLPQRGPPVIQRCRGAML